MTVATRPSTSATLLCADTSGSPNIERCLASGQPHVSAQPTRNKQREPGAIGLKLGQPPVPPGRGRAIAAAPRVQQPAAAPAQARALPPQPLGAAVHGEHRIEVVLCQVAPLAGSHLDRPRDIALERDDVVCAARAGALGAQRTAAALALSSTSCWCTSSLLCTHPRPHVKVATPTPGIPDTTGCSKCCMHLPQA